MYIYIHIYILCIYMYIFIYIYIHIYIYSCTYIYTHANPYMITDLFFLWPLWSKSSAYGMLSSQIPCYYPMGNSSWIIAHQVRIWGSLIRYLKNLGFYYR